MIKKKSSRKAFQLTIPSLVTTRTRQTSVDPPIPSPILISSSHPISPSPLSSTTSTCSFEPGQIPEPSSITTTSITPVIRQSGRSQFQNASDVQPHAKDSYFPKNYIELPYVPPHIRSNQCTLLNCFTPKASSSLYCPTHIICFKNFSLQVLHANNQLILTYIGSLTIPEGSILPSLFITGKLVNNLQALLIADHNHLVKITNTLYLDTSHSISTFDVSNLTKFIHHSTKPNIRIQPFKDQLTSETQFFFVALKSIKQTDFISLNYGDHYKPPPNVLENAIFRI